MFPLLPEHESFAKRFGVALSTGYGSTEEACPLIHHFGEPSEQPVRRIPDLAFRGEDTRRSGPGVPTRGDGRDLHPAQEPLGHPGRVLGAPRVHRAGVPKSLVPHRRCRLPGRRRTLLLRRPSHRFDAPARRRTSLPWRWRTKSTGIPTCWSARCSRSWDEHTEQEVMTVITPKPESRIEPAELIAFLDRRMAYFMIPPLHRLPRRDPQDSDRQDGKVQTPQRGHHPHHLGSGGGRSQADSLSVSSSHFGHIGAVGRWIGGLKEA